MNTRTIAIIALIIGVIALIFLVGCDDNLPNESANNIVTENVYTDGETTLPRTANSQ